MLPIHQTFTPEIDGIVEIKQIGPCLNKVPYLDCLFLNDFTNKIEGRQILTSVAVIAAEADTAPPFSPLRFSSFIHFLLSSLNNKK